MSLGFGHHSCITSSEEPPLSNFNSYWDIPPKKMMAEIKAHEGSMIEITGLMKKGQYKPGGVGIGGGVRIAPGPASTGGSLSGNPSVDQLLVDIEGWRPIVGACPSR